MGFGGKEEGSRGYSPYLHSHSHLLWLEKRIEERRGEEEKRRGKLGLCTLQLEVVESLL